jgi:hypothetical protein
MVKGFLFFVFYLKQLFFYYFGDFMEPNHSFIRFLKIYSSQKEEMDSLLSEIYVGFSRTIFKGSKVKDFYNPPQSAISPVPFEEFLEKMGIKALNVTKADLKKELEGKVVKTIGKFPTENTTSYGIIRGDISFDGNNIILGKNEYNYTAGDPNFWRTL